MEEFIAFVFFGTIAFAMLFLIFGFIRAIFKTDGREYIEDSDGKIIQLDSEGNIVR